MSIVPKQQIYLFSAIILASLLLRFLPERIFTPDEPIVAQVTPTIKPLPTPPAAFAIPQKTWVSQTYNNCGPATLSMALSYSGISVSQDELGKKLRPWQNPEGNNDDKSVFLPELVSEAKNYNLVGYYRPNGSIELLKKLTSNNFPVIVRTWLHPNEDIGHYRIIRGYDDTTGEIIQDDSYEGANLRYSYDDLLSMWQPFNYEYVVIIPKNKEQILRQIIGNGSNEKIAWTHAKLRAEKELAKNPDSIYAAFNKSASEYHLNETDEAIKDFEKIESSLPPRMLWYQTEPIEAYLKVKNAERVLAMTENILANNNLAYSEMYILRGKAYLSLGNKDLAREEFEKAIQFNSNLVEAKNALTSVQ